MGILSQNIKITTPLLREMKSLIEQAQKEFNVLDSKDKLINKKSAEVYKKLLVRLQSSLDKVEYNINYLQR